MNIDLMPTLIDMYRETFEGEVQPGMCWIVSGPAEASVLGSLAALSAQQAYQTPPSGGKSIAGHAAHLKFTLELTCKRLQGENPPADWASSFQVAEPSAAAWEQLQRELQAAYDAVLSFYNHLRDKLVSAWEPIQVVALAAMIGHNAYHLGAIRQLMREVR